MAQGLGPGTAGGDALRVLDLSAGVAAAYAARLLGDQGADVVKAEPPGGDPARRRGPFPAAAPDPECSGLFLALNQNKRGILLDPASPAYAAELDRLLDWAQVVVHDCPNAELRSRRLEDAALLARRPDLVVLSITPFGRSGPYSDYKGVELTVANASGWASLCPCTHPEPEFPPLKAFGHQCALMTGIAGAMVALAMARQARRTGQGEVIDLAEQAYVAGILEAGIPTWSYAGEVAKRTGLRPLIPWRIFEAADGPVFLVCIEQDQWERLVDFMGRPDWTELELFADFPGRSENQDLVHQLVQEFIAPWRVEELYHAAQQRRICVSPVASPRQFGASPHLRARGFFEPVTHPVAGTYEALASAALPLGGRAPVRRPAPLLGQHTAEVLASLARAPAPGAEAVSAGPLTGIRVLDLTWVWAGTFCSLNLAHLGAEVIRCESEARPDLYRRLGPFDPALEPGLNRAGHFNQWNQGKESISVDLSRPEGVALVKELVARCDVVVQNFATGVMDRLGLGYEVLRSINPAVVLASISGYGQSGPSRAYMGYGPATAPLTGLSAVTGYVGGGPEEMGLSMPDPNAGITAALAIVAALQRRDATGQGDHLDVSLLEATGALGIEFWMQHALAGTQPERMGNRDPWMSPHGVFPCAGDDEWISIACADDRDWQQLAGLLDPALAGDPRFRTLADRQAAEAELEARIADWTRGQDRWALTRTLQALGIAAFPNLTCRDIVEDPHLNERGFIERLPHPEVGARAHTGIPWRLRQRPSRVQSPSPCIGADTDEVLQRVLGYSPERIAQLRTAGVFG